MRYDWKEVVGYREFSKEFYEEIDKRFFGNAKEYLKDKSALPFSELIDFDNLKNLDVLEIGVGNGSHAQLLATHSKSFTGIDLTEYGVNSTSKRLVLFNISAKVVQMDAEKLNFPDNSFDFVWSWGVIHHSSNTKEILREIARVLRPGGRVMTMVYHRGWWNYYVIGLLRALLSGNIFKGISLSESVQLQTDGAIARYYTCGEWRKFVGEFFEVEKVVVMGPKTDIIPLPGGRLKSFVMWLVPIWLNKLCTRNLKMGVFLVSEFVSERHLTNRNS